MTPIFQTLVVISTQTVMMTQSFQASEETKMSSNNSSRTTKCLSLSEAQLPFSSLSHSSLAAAVAEEKKAERTPTSIELILRSKEIMIKLRPLMRTTHPMLAQEFNDDILFVSNTDL